MTNQLDLPLRSWGGRRAGAGRRAIGQPQASHHARPKHCARYPVHVTLRLARGLPSAREQALAAVIRGSLRDARAAWFRVAHYSIQTNHVHLLVEADDEQALSRGMARVNIRLAKRLNCTLARRGRVVAERYHARALKTPREVRFALAYVLLNARKHGRRLSGIDPLSSGLAFDGWQATPPSGAPSVRDDLGVTPAQSWLMRVGWRRYGLLDADERPGRGG